MLDTLLEIGRILRLDPEGLKHHRYVKPAPLPSKDNPVKFWTVPVASDGSFDFAACELLENEARQRSLFYLNYKTSDADSLKKYVMGDIYRTITKTGEDGNYRFGDPNSGAATFRLSSFLRGEADASNFNSEWLNQFRNSFREQLSAIEAFITEQKNVYLHFDCNGADWYTRPEFDLYNTLMLGSFGRETPNGYVLGASLYKTIGVGDSATPGFGHDGNKQFRNRVFKTLDDLLNLVYAVDMSTRSVIRKGDMKVIVLPRGDGLEAEDIERFFGVKSLKKAQEDEGNLNDKIKYAEEESPDIDEVFMPVEKPEAQKFAQFDFIFSKASSSASAPDADMIEISGLERSKLSDLAARVLQIKAEVEAARAEFFPNLKKPLDGLSIMRSFLALLGDTTRAKKKYHSHLFSVLPQIYTETYFRDPVLLPALIKKTEFHLREGVDVFNFLRFDFLFLTRISIEGDTLLNTLQDSKSYQLGLSLGLLARPLRSRINSFDKNYAGLLSRRIGSISDLMAFSVELNQKLIMHDCVGFTRETSYQLSQELKSFYGRYDKDECAFGFFESYYAPIPKKETEGDPSK